MTSNQALQQIEKEFATAHHAQSIGNDGMVRVCARRAAGAAISFWLQTNVRNGWGANAMTQLRNVQRDESLPLEVRDAAKRLTTKITEQFTSPFSTNPTADTKIIINHFMEQA